MPKLYVHNWKARYLKRAMDRYGLTPDLIVAFSGLPIEHLRHMIAGEAPVSVQVAAIVRLYAAAPKNRRLKIAAQLVAALPPQELTWKQIAGFPTYEVSERGDVRRNGRILRPVPSKYGHLGVTLYNGHKQGTVARGRKIGIHQLVARAFLGDPPFPGAIVRHLNGHPFDNRRDNLSWGTVRDNVNDRREHFRNGKPRPDVDMTWTGPVRYRVLKQKTHTNSGLAK